MVSRTARKHGIDHGNNVIAKYTTTDCNRHHQETGPQTGREGTTDIAGKDDSCSADNTITAYSSGRGTNTTRG